MAKAISDEELQLKKRARRRLVGAVALVLLIVVFLPMILDSEPKPLNQDVTITIPPIPKPESMQQNPAPAIASTPAPPSPPRVVGMPAPAPALQSDPAPPSVEAKPDVSNNAPAKPAAKPAPKPVQKHETKPAPASHAAGEEDFVVQLGAFSNAANAKALQKKLQDNKFKAYTEIVKNAGGDRMRVRVGPYPTREAAEKARNRLEAMKLIIGEAAVVRRD